MAVFTAVHGEPPWDCFFCHTSVTQLGQKTWDGNVHHVDGDKSNDVPENVVPAHTICHLQHHRPTEEMRKRISRKLQGRPSPTKGMKFPDRKPLPWQGPGNGHLAPTYGKPGHNKGGRGGGRGGGAGQGELNPFYGKTHSENVRQRIADENRRQVTCNKCGVEIAARWLNRHQKAGCPKTRQITINGVTRVRGVEPKITCTDCGKPYASRWMKRHKDNGQCTPI